MSWLDNNVRRVFDITDVGAIVYKLHIFYVDWCIFLVKVSSPADSVLKWWIIPSIHLPLGVVEKLQLEKRTHELFSKAEVLNSSIGILWRVLIKKDFIWGAPIKIVEEGHGKKTISRKKYNIIKMWWKKKCQISSNGTQARQGFRNHGAQPFFSWRNKLVHCL